MKWIVMPLRRVADVKGRSCRREYWTYMLAVWMPLYVAAAFATDNFNTHQPPGTGFFAAPLIKGALVVLLIAATIPAICVQVRRLHDQDRSAWALLLGFIPYAGPFFMGLFMFTPGTIGPNRFGPDPIERNYVDLFG